MTTKPTALPELNDDSLARVSAVTKLKPGSHVHISGVCGTGTAAVLSLLKQLGFTVSGSDKAFYPPMGAYVKGLADKLYEGFDAKNVQPRPDLVVIGNSLSRGNPEVEQVLSEKIPFASMPEIFQALLIGTRAQCSTSVVVIGTHGKTTTSALIATLLDQSGRKPGYFIGGIPKNLPGNVRPVDVTIPLEQRVVVLEGDEYDSAFFAKWPKFHSYRPDILIVTSLEFDHGDIYESVEQIETEFTRVARRVPEGGTILLCDDSQKLKNLGKDWKKNALVKAKILLYGEQESSAYRLHERTLKGSGEQQMQRISVALGQERLEVQSALLGRYGALNMLAAASVGKLLGLSTKQLQSGIKHYAGVLRRQQVVYNKRELLIIEDFAHHPTEVSTTLQGLKEGYPTKRLVAVFEPRSNTSRRSFFQEQYEQSFQAADVVVMLEILVAEGYSKTTTPVVPLNVQRIVEKLSNAGKEAYSFKTVAEIKDFLLEFVCAGDLVVVMSNGDFGGLLEQFVSEVG